MLSFQFIGAFHSHHAGCSYFSMKMTRADHGYQAENVFYCSTSGIDGNKIASVMHEPRSLPEVELAGMGCVVPTDGIAGNNVFSPDCAQKELFNVADLYSAGRQLPAILAFR